MGGGALAVFLVLMVFSQWWAGGEIRKFWRGQDQFLGEALGNYREAVERLQRKAPGGTVVVLDNLVDNAFEGKAVFGNSLTANLFHETLHRFAFPSSPAGATRFVFEQDEHAEEQGSSLVVMGWGGRLLEKSGGAPSE